MPEIQAYPTLFDIMSDQSAIGTTIRNNTRKYNVALSLTSMGVSIDKDLANGYDGVYTYRIQGALVHELGSLRAQPREPSKFAQILFYGPDKQVTHRGEIFGDTCFIVR